VSVVSGHLAGRTEPLTLYVEDRYQAFDPVGTYTAAVVLALLAFATLAAMNWLAGKEKR
jgi:sulfate transport system permease protein